MIEAIVLNYLNSRLPIDVFAEIPPNPREKYVVIDKIGSVESDHLPSSILAVRSYAESKYEASLLNEEVKTVVKQMIELDEIAGIELNSDYNFTDTSTKEYRYQAVFEIRHY